MTRYRWYAIIILAATFTASIAVPDTPRVHPHTSNKGGVLES